MNTIPVNTVILVAIALILIGAVVAWAVMQRRRTQRLRQRYGQEYTRTVNELGGRSKAEADLIQREQRVARLHITPLATADAAKFSQAWNGLQSRFIDNPKGVVAEADRLVRELMVKRGYPMGDFEHRAADISVDHPGVVSNYRAAQVIAARDERGEADTEELRKAVVHYRTLFDDLLEVDPAAASAPTATLRIPVHS
jgi:hypothetical protein